MLTAYVAYSNLTATTKSAVDTLINVLAATYPESPDFFTAACWADDLKSLGVTEYNYLHYVDIPVFRGPIWFAYPAVGNTSNNPWAINQALNTLTSTYSTQLDAARQLRFLLHFAGDLHQPLHAAELVSAQFPTGDGGGNGYPVAGVQESNLHSYWDSGAEQWIDDLVRPLNATGLAWLDSTAKAFTAAFPVTGFAPQLAETDPFMWAVESHGLADSFVYTAPQSPTPIPADYQAQAAVMSQSQIALGGYRLAAMLERTFNPTPQQLAEREAAQAEAMTIARGILAQRAAAAAGGKHLRGTA